MVGKPGSIDFYEALQYLYRNYINVGEEMNQGYLVGDLTRDWIVNINDVVNLAG